MRVILVQAIPLNRSKKKLPISDLVIPAGDPTAFLTRHPCSGDHANLLWIIQQKKPSQSLLFKRKKKDYTSRIVFVSLVQDHANLLSAEDKNLTRLQREIRTFGRAVEGSSVSLLTNAVGGLSGGRRGGDTSGAITAPSFVGARPRVGPWALVLATGTCCPPFFISKAYASDGSSTPRRKSSAMR